MYLPIKPVIKKHFTAIRDKRLANLKCNKFIRTLNIPYQNDLFLIKLMTNLLKITSTHSN